MIDQEAQDKKNFLMWYEMADIKDLQKAMEVNPKKLISLSRKYAAEIEMIHRLI